MRYIERSIGPNNSYINTIKLVLAFAAIYLVWGTTYLAIRIAIDTIPPFLMSGVRFVTAGLIFYTWCLFRGDKKPTLSDWKRNSIAGMLMFVIGHGSLTWSEQFISSGLAALVIATIPIWVVLFEWIRCKSNRPKFWTMIGIVLGVSGVLFLFGADNSVLSDSSRQGYSTILGLSVLIAAAISWALGSIYSRNTQSNTSLQFSIAMQTLMGGSVLIIVGLIRGESSQISFEDISIFSILSLGYLIIFGTLIAYSSYLWLLKKSTPSKVSTYAYFNPLVAIFLGGVIADEAITLHMLIGASCILISIFLIHLPALFKSHKGRAERLANKLNHEDELPPVRLK